MAQFQSPETYVDGQQVTATRLNNQTNGAIALAGLITDQSNITANTVASGDSVLLYDLSATALREANVSDVLGSNVPVTTSAVTGGANSDIVLTPNDGTIVTGQAYTSGDGLTVTVTSTAHGLVVGQVILVTAAATGYNGTFRVATAATNSFTYVMTTAATAGSSTLSYTKKGAIRNAGNESVAGSLFVAGSAVLSGATALTGATTVSGATTATNLTATLTTASTAITQTSTDNSTKVATTAFVNAWSPVKAWVNFDGIGSTIGANLTIRASFNVTNVVYNGTGNYTINFTNALSDANYAVLGTGSNDNGTGAPVIGVATSPVVKTITQLRICSAKDSTGNLSNMSIISVLILR
jgi:hypothetical protein